MRTVLFSLTIFLLSVLPTLAQSQTPIDRLTNVGENTDLASGVSTPSLARSIGLIIHIALSLLGLIFLIYLIYAGYLWLTAAGAEEKITKAKAIIRGSIIGVIIVLAAYAITTFVVTQISSGAGGQTPLIGQ